jgi:hypothetical protein
MVAARAQGQTAAETAQETRMAIINPAVNLPVVTPTCPFAVFHLYFLYISPQMSVKSVLRRNLLI